MNRETVLGILRKLRTTRSKDRTSHLVLADAVEDLGLCAYAGYVRQAVSPDYGEVSFRDAVCELWQLVGLGPCDFLVSDTVRTARPFPQATAKPTGIVSLRDGVPRKIACAASVFLSDAWRLCIFPVSSVRLTDRNPFVQIQNGPVEWAHYQGRRRKGQLSRDESIANWPAYELPSRLYERLKRVRPAPSHDDYGDELLVGLRYTTASVAWRALSAACCLFAAEQWDGVSLSS